MPGRAPVAFWGPPAEVPACRFDGPWGAQEATHAWREPGVTEAQSSRTSSLLPAERRSSSLTLEQPALKNAHTRARGARVGDFLVVVLGRICECVSAYRCSELNARARAFVKHGGLGGGGLTPLSLEPTPTMPLVFKQREPSRRPPHPSP